MPLVLTQLDFARVVNSKAGLDIKIPMLLLMAYLNYRLPLGDVALAKIRELIGNDEIYDAFQTCSNFGNPLSADRKILERRYCAWAANEVFAETAEQKTEKES